MLVTAARPPANPSVPAVRDPNPCVNIFARPVAPPEVLCFVSFTCSGFWWMNNKMNELCDRNTTVEEVTKKVNGGYNGISDRKMYYNRTLEIIK